MIGILTAFGKILIDALLDTLKLAPFLYLMFVLMEFIEHKASKKTLNMLARSGRISPLVGALCGAVPQCGFSAAAAGLYAGRVVSVGTLLAVFLSTSDELIPVLISGGAQFTTALNIVGFKVAVGIVVGFAADAIVNLKRRHRGGDFDRDSIHDLCESEHCNCGNGIWHSALHHAVRILIVIFALSVILGTTIELIGEDSIKTAFISTPFVGNMISALIGLIPNCAASVIITELYLESIITPGAMISGLLAGSGIGIFVLMRNNRRPIENAAIIVTLLIVGILCGTLVDLIGITF